MAVHATTMRVLYVTTRPPVPPDRGDQLIAYEHVNGVGNSCELQLRSVDEGLQDEIATRQALAPYGATLHLVRHGKDERRAWRSLYNGLPVLVNLFLDAPIRQAIEAACAAVRHEGTLLAVNPNGTDVTPELMDSWERNVETRRRLWRSVPRRRSPAAS